MRENAKPMQPIPLLWLECDESDLPADTSWVSDAETECFRSRWVPKRRREWLLGRWTAKSALASHFQLSCDPAVFRTISIVPGKTGAPFVTMQGEPTGVSLSISHRDGRALAVISTQRTLLGCDLEKAEPHTRVFVETFFTPQEIELVQHAEVRERASIESMIWSAKESVLKVLAVGLRVDTRSVSVNIKGAPRYHWQQFSALIADGRNFAGWWCREGNWLRTVACSVATSVSRSLDLPRAGLGYDPKRNSN